MTDLEALLESMLVSTEKKIQEKTKRLMNDHSLNYDEARIKATNMVIQSSNYRLTNELEKELIMNDRK